MQVIRFQYMDVCSLMDSCDDVDDYDVMLFDIFVLVDVIDEFPLSVQDTCQIKDADGIDRPPWTPDRVREWIVLV